MLLKFKNTLLIALSLVLIGTLTAEDMEVRVTSSSELQTAPTFLVADNDPATFWIAPDPKKENELLLTFPRPIMLNKIELHSLPGINSNTYIVEASSDGKNWVELARDEKGGMKDATIAPPKPLSCRIIRIRMKGRLQGMAEIRVNGNALRDPGAPKIPAVPKNAPYKNRKLAPEKRAENALSLMTLYEKAQMVGGYNMRYIRGVKRLGLRDMPMVDASSGIHISSHVISDPNAKSISYPSLVSLAAAWDRETAKAYSTALSEECRSMGIDILLGPGFNLYRVSWCGRNYEYLGEDPVLAAETASAYIEAMQSCGILPTAKHYICNNNEWRRGNIDAIVDDRTLHELYLYPWYKVVRCAGVAGIMSSYNKLNGEKVSLGKTALDKILRGELGYQGIIMSDWGAARDSSLVLESGLDIPMPVNRDFVTFTKTLTAASMPRLDAIVKRILTAGFKLGIYDRDRFSTELASKRPQWEKVALETSRKSITLLKNNGILPLGKGPVLVVGPSADITLHTGGGSGRVEGYDRVNIYQALVRILGADNVSTTKWRRITDDQIRKAKTLVVCLDHATHEGRDTYPMLAKVQEDLIRRCTSLNPRTIVVINSGGGIEMEWASKAAAIVWAYLPGQYGATAIAEVLTGKVNPSGKLPYTIEKKLEDGPLQGKTPKGSHWDYLTLVDDKKGANRPKAIYSEGIFIGYRWYDKKKLDVRYPFGHGLSYTLFAYSNCKAKATDKGIEVSATIKNTGKRAGAEVVQIYVQEKNPIVERPVRELKDFARVKLAPGESKEVRFLIPPVALAYYDEKQKNWLTRSGEYVVDIAASSRDIKKSAVVEWQRDLRFQAPTDKVPLQ